MDPERARFVVARVKSRDMPARRDADRFPRSAGDRGLRLPHKSIHVDMDIARGGPGLVIGSI